MNQSMGQINLWKLKILMNNQQKITQIVNVSDDVSLYPVENDTVNEQPTELSADCSTVGESEDISIKSELNLWRK